VSTDSNAFFQTCDVAPHLRGPHPQAASGQGSGRETDSNAFEWIPCQDSRTKKEQITCVGNKATPQLLARQYTHRCLLHTAALRGRSLALLGPGLGFGSARLPPSASPRRVQFPSAPTGNSSHQGRSRQMPPTDTPHRMAGETTATHRDTSARRRSRNLPPRVFDGVPASLRRLLSAAVSAAPLEAAGCLCSLSLC
jgi:hypothetical protein